MLKVITLLPLNDNGGKMLPSEVIDEILQGLTRQFQGCTTEGTVVGRSMDGDVEHRDESLRVSIICDDDRIQEIRDRIVDIGRSLGQKSMYFEVQTNAPVQFLSTK